jgi:hypothetical protein
MTLVKGNLRIGVHTRFGPNWPGKRCLAKTRRAQPVRGPHTSTMGAARYMAGGQLDLRLSGAYRAFQTLIFGTGGRRRINWQPSATRQRSGVGLRAS